MTEQENVIDDENLEETSEQEPKDEAKEAMLESVQEFTEETAQVEPTTQPEEVLEEETEEPESEAAEDDGGAEPEKVEAEEEDKEAEPEEAAAEEGDQSPPLVDLNTATIQELRKLPGIGPTLAQRIVDYRAEAGPFEEPVELTAVEGISEGTYRSVADRLMVSLPTEAEVDEGLLDLDEMPEPEELLPEPEEPEELLPEPELEEEEALPEPEVEGALPPPPEAPSQPPTRVVVQERGSWGPILFVGLLSAFAGAILALVVLFFINNGTLDFRRAAIREARQETHGLGIQMGHLNDSIVDLEDRLVALQDLSGRMDQAQTDIQALTENLRAAQTEIGTLAEGLDTLQTEFPNLREDLDALAVNLSNQSGRIDGIATQLEDIGEDLDAVEEAAAQFDAFLQGLRHLLNESMGAPTPTPWMTPTSFPTPAMGVTQTPGSQVTVIPVQTPTPTP